MDTVEARIFRISVLIPFLITLWVVSFTTQVKAESAPENKDCLECHDATISEIGRSYDKALKESIHSGLECVDCHSSIVELPHEEKVLKVNCGTCHSTEAEIYQWHGRLHVSDASDIPSCGD
jgi:nitrate/TMAO reductase-like tetraheme cytochrome c subunit